jgi:glycosyltransferase involved in cell wall biosynthesis
MTDDRIIHLGSYRHERYSVQRLVLAATETETSSEEAAASGLSRRRILCWHPHYWAAIPADRRAHNRVVCFFYHHAFEHLGDPQIIAGIVMTRRMLELLRQSHPEKPVRLAHVGGAEDAILHARRDHPTEKIRLLMAGDARAPMSDGSSPSGMPSSRKGPELILPIAERLDPNRYAWTFIGPGWELSAEALCERGWTVLCPGELPEPEHYAYFGEGDIYLMLSRQEGGPLTLLEAMGVGLWPIGTDTGLMPELVTHGENGHILPAYHGANAAAVADATADLIRSLDREVLLNAAPRVRKSVVRRTWTNFKAEIDAILTEVFDGDGPPDDVTSDQFRQK